MDSRKCSKGSRRRLVVVRGLFARAAARKVACEQERAAAAVGVARRLQLGLVGEEELESAVPVGARLGNVEAEDGGDVVGREHAVELRAEGFVGVQG